MLNRLWNINGCLEYKCSCNRSSFGNLDISRVDSNIRERKNSCRRITIFHCPDLHRDGNILIFSIKEYRNRCKEYTTFFINQERLCERVPPTNLSRFCPSRVDCPILTYSISNNICISDSKDVFLDSIQGTCCSIFCLCGRCNSTRKT